MVLSSRRSTSAILISPTVVGSSRSRVEGNERTVGHRAPNAPEAGLRRRMSEGRGPKPPGCGDGFQVVNTGTDFSIFPRHNSGAGDRSIETMFSTKLKTAALVLPACLVFTGTSFLVHQAPAENPPQAQAKAGSKAANQ